MQLSAFLTAAATAALLPSIVLSTPVDFERTDVEAPTLIEGREPSPVQLEARQGQGSVNNYNGLGWYDPTLTDGTSGYPDPNTYNCYSGPSLNFPARAKWMAFNKMWPFLRAAAIIPIGDTPTEAQYIYNSIVNISATAKVDARVILAVIILESTGNVHVNCTYNGVKNCGLMQSHGGGSYNASMSATSIFDMIRDGTQGVAPPVNGPGLVQYFNDNPNTYVTTNGSLWRSLRGYNSGAINATNLSQGLGASPSYVSDIANYLQGWHGYGNNSQTMNCGFHQ